MKRAVFAALALAAAVSACAQEFPVPAQVVDEAGKLSSQGRREILSLLQTEERATGNQIAVVVVRDLRGHVVEEYANRLYRTWGIGKSNKDNGVLLLVAMKERKVRIEVGYGFESRLTDAKAKRIIQSITPALKSGDFDSGLRQGAAQIINVINGKE